MTGDVIAFYFLGGAAVLTAVAVIAARDVVRAVLYMIANFILTALLYLMLQAAFLATVQVIVYAGAIMVLFLFVVMVLGGGHAGLDERLEFQRPLGVMLVLALGAVLVVVTANAFGSGTGGGQREGSTWPADPLPSGFGSPTAIGERLFSEHVLALEIVSILLLVAIVGAVTIAHFLPRGPVLDGDGAARPDSSDEA